MTRPQDALERAREAVARKRAAGDYAGEGETAFRPVEDAVAGGTPSLERLHEWAAIEVDPKLARSTRRLGAPITALKRGLLRLLRQHSAELNAQQSRFNMSVLAYARSLEERVERLEAEASSEGPAGPRRGGD